MGLAEQVANMSLSKILVGGEDESAWRPTENQLGGEQQVDASCGAWRGKDRTQGFQGPGRRQYNVRVRSPFF